MPSLERIARSAAPGPPLAATLPLPNVLPTGSHKSIADRWHTPTILLLALLPRLGVLYYALTHYAHTWLYTRIELGTLARSLALNQGFNSPFGGSTGPTAFMTPGYPFLISIVFRVFGIFSLDSVIAMLVLHIAFAVVTVWLMLHIARETLGVRVANVAGVYWALSLPLVWMPVIFWDTSASTMLLTGMVALALRLARRPTLLLWSAAGLYCGLTLLINPSLLLALLGILGWTAYQTRSAHRAPGAGPMTRYSPAIGLLVLLSVFAWWPIRNVRALHAFIPLRSSLGLELWDGNQHGGDGRFIEALHPAINPVEFKEYATLGEVAYMHKKGALAEATIRAYPREFLRVTAWRVSAYWLGLAQGAGANSPLIIFHSVLTTFPALAGLLLLFRRERQLFWLFLLPLLVLPLPYYITHPDFRFRLLIDPLITILAAYAVTVAWTAFRRYRPAPSTTTRAWH